MRITREELIKQIKKCNYYGNFSILREVNTSSISDFSEIFKNCEKIKDLNFTRGWDFSNATDIREIFMGCCGLYDISAAGSWNLPDVGHAKKNKAFCGAHSVPPLQRILFLENSMRDDFRRKTYERLSKEQLEDLYNSIIEPTNK